MGNDTKFSRKMVFYAIAILAGIYCGFTEIQFLGQIGKFCSEVFIRMFRCISMPIISLSVIVALFHYSSNKEMSAIWKKTLFYTLVTTVIAASVAAILYVTIKPSNVNIAIPENIDVGSQNNYTQYLLEIMPSSILEAFLEHKVLSVLLVSVIIGVSIGLIKDNKAKNSVILFFKGMHDVFFVITKFIVKILPIGLFGFITVSIRESRGNVDLMGMGAYFLIVVLANILQGTIVLPIFLACKKINPLRAFRAMLPALSVAFFSKSSAATLPVTMEMAETKLGVSPKISKFTLPLCTTINMNGCAAFIFTTVIYLMQNYGVAITPITLLTWVIIATIAAVGNAGVPMGCFFLSASLLSSIGIPIPLMGVILPFYSIIDMIETALNVWSDSCVTAIVNKTFAGH
ncbi:MAG: dicarboxylate/amino acid:cation symporter [Puniceicoccales bacterium]|jgi:Na+/H+-dicarboxylate symporter|nr:dicarboxylate/amino acid:cation symporter [Puniceicoccales bacterium]